MAGGGLSTARLARMREVMAGHAEHGGVPGIVTVVARRDEVHVDTFGTLALGGAPVRADSVFRIASMTKPVAAVAALTLVEDCVLRLDDPVDPLLPELADRRVLRSIDARLEDTVPAARSITLRDLLTFRMGFGFPMAMPGTYPVQAVLEDPRLGQGPPRPGVVAPPDEWLGRLAALPLMYQPGETWLYNTSADVLGVLLARATGQPLETVLRERVLDPLGMAATGFSVPAERIGRFATAYALDPATGDLAVYDQAEGGQWSRPPSFPSAAAGLVSTAEDFLAFSRMLLAGGRHPGGRLLSRPTVETMTTDQLTPSQKSDFPGDFFADHGWGFGLSVVTRRTEPAGSVGTFGWNGGLGTSWDADPREDLTAILLTQRLWASPVPPAVCTDFRTLAHAAIDD